MLDDVENPAKSSKDILKFASFYELASYHDVAQNIRNRVPMKRESLRSFLLKTQRLPTLRETVLLSFIVVLRKMSLPLRYAQGVRLLNAKSCFRHAAVQLVASIASIELTFEFELFEHLNRRARVKTVGRSKTRRVSSKIHAREDARRINR